MLICRAGTWSTKMPMKKWNHKKLKSWVCIRQLRKTNKNAVNKFMLWKWRCYSNEWWLWCSWFSFWCFFACQCCCDMIHHHIGWIVSQNQNTSMADTVHQCCWDALTQKIWIHYQQKENMLYFLHCSMFNFFGWMLRCLHILNLSHFAYQPTKFQETTWPF